MSNENTTSTNIFRILRTCMGLSLKEMSERCKISAIYLNELELGKKTKPSEEIIQRFANACGIKPQTISFFIEQQQGESLDYQKCLLESLERLANKLQKANAEE